jgi:hypothetical protein
MGNWIHWTCLAEQNVSNNGSSRTEYYLSGKASERGANRPGFKSQGDWIKRDAIQRV